MRNSATVRTFCSGGRVVHLASGRPSRASPNIAGRRSLSNMRSDDQQCADVSLGGKRCQLYVAHEMDHAAAWRDLERAKRRHRGEPLDPLTVDRWGLAGQRVEQWLDDGEVAHYRLPWAPGHP